MHYRVNVNRILVLLRLDEFQDLNLKILMMKISLVVLVRLKEVLLMVQYHKLFLLAIKQSIIKLVSHLFAIDFKEKKNILYNKNLIFSILFKNNFISTFFPIYLTGFYRITLTVLEPYVPEYADTYSQSYLELSRNLTQALDELFSHEIPHYNHFANVVKIS